MTEDIGRRRFIENILAAGTLAGCGLPRTSQADAQDTQDELNRLAAALNTNLLQRKSVAYTDNPDAFQQTFQDADYILAVMKNLSPPKGTDYNSFQNEKLRYVAIAASNAIKQGAGSLVVQIAAVFPELTMGPITLPEIGKYDLGTDLAAHYPKAGDVPLKNVQADLNTLLIQYQKQFDDGANAPRTGSISPTNDRSFVKDLDTLNSTKGAIQL